VIEQLLGTQIQEALSRLPAVKRLTDSGRSGFATAVVLGQF
jgi:hypothetical protein